MAQQKYTQAQQVIDTLRKTGGYATLGDLYHLVDTNSWATKTPNESIRRIFSNLTKYLKYSQVFGHWRNVVKKLCANSTSAQRKKRALSNLHMVTIKDLL